jgi:hypothetical protein
MPIHDWTRVRANRFHDFHQTWIGTIRRALNAGLLPPGYTAMREQITGGPEPDVVTLELPNDPVGSPAGTTVLDTPPAARFVVRADAQAYAGKTDRLSIYHPDGKVVSVIEVVSPGNKSSRDAVRAFARKAVHLLRAGIHLLVIDLFPPSRRDPQGVHKLIWDRIAEDDFRLPPDKPLTLASYSGGPVVTGYIEAVGVGDVLPAVPIFLTPELHIRCPLEPTYEAAWAEFPESLRGPLLSPPA